MKLSLRISLSLVILAQLFGGSLRAQDEEAAAPALRFGLLADVQYADKPDNGKRAYRQSLEHLKACAAELRGLHPAFVLQLGDIIDGGASEQESVRDLQRVLAVLDSIGVPLRHVVGNHCFSIPREELLAQLELARAHGSFRAGGWRFIQLDTLDVSVCGRAPGSPQYAAAERWLAEHGPSGAKNAQRWNGGVGQSQLAWLAQELAAAETAGERVLVSGHLPLLSEASSEWHVLWNADEVLALLEASPSVVAYFSGHDHAGGYAVRAGIHHLTLPGMLEAGPEQNAWAIVEVHPDRLELIGHGLVASRRLERAGSALAK